MLEKTFKILTINNPIDLIPYIKEYVNTHPNIEILIGCDSQNRKRETVYAIVVGLYSPGKGAHVLYSRYTTPREKDIATRLTKEVWASIEVAEHIKNELGIITKYIDIDVNADLKYKSNTVLASMIGLCNGLGYKPRYKNSPEKGNTPLVTYMCDHLVHK